MPPQAWRIPPAKVHRVGGQGWKGESIAWAFSGIPVMAHRSQEHLHTDRWLTGIVMGESRQSGALHHCGHALCPMAEAQNKTKVCKLCLYSERGGKRREGGNEKIRGKTVNFLEYVYDVVWWPLLALGMQVLSIKQSRSRVSKPNPICLD